jgi:hypothetical protein
MGLRPKPRARFAVALALPTLRAGSTGYGTWNGLRPRKVTIDTAFGKTWAR